MAGVDVGKDTDARRFAEELERLIPKYRGDWNQRNAIRATKKNVVLEYLEYAESFGGCRMEPSMSG